MNLVGLLLAAASFAFYSAVFGLLPSALFMAGLAAHALGHVFAARHWGIVASVRFVPLLGVVELLDDEAPSRLAAMMIAVAGPLVGGVFALGLLGLGGVFDAQTVRLSGALLLSVNVMNLLPIPPLDGGRIIKAFFFSS